MKRILILIALGSLPGCFTTTCGLISYSAATSHNSTERKIALARGIEDPGPDWDVSSKTLTGVGVGLVIDSAIAIAGALTIMNAVHHM
jgi:hypothetical protein